ncbi:MAG: N-acetylneuraminate synthase [Anaerolineae bacterium]|nr:N-acetylneuraminate synthase [Anaerolineae bacterium]
MLRTIEFGGHKVGPGCPVFIIAEIGVNHNGDVGLAQRSIAAAARAGASAVKFQTFIADQVISPLAPKADYQKRRTEAVESQLDMVRRLELSADAHRSLVACCKEHGILFLSTPFDTQSVELLSGLGVSAFKIGSGEITNLPFLEYVACKGKPVILSTGMSHLSEVDEAVRAIRATGNDQIVLLQCVSNYPADPTDANLRAMRTMSDAFGVPVGFSDHTLGTQVALAAVALGACVLEKHFTLDRTLSGPDHAASLEPPEFAVMVRDVRTVESALGDGRKEPAASEANTASVARRSLVAAVDIPAGARITEELVAARRPGTGLPPGARPYVVGRTARQDIPAHALITLEMLV